MRAHSYVPVKEPTNHITSASIALIILLLCQLMLPLMNHHAFDFYPNHPHLPNTSHHSHSYINLHSHQESKTFNRGESDQSKVITELAFLPDSYFAPGLISVLFIWKWTSINFIAKSSSRMIKFISTPPKYLMSISYPVQTNPPISSF